MVTYTIQEEDKLEAKRLARRKYSKEYYQRNKEQIKAKNKIHYLENRDWYLCYFKNYYQEKGKLNYLKNRWIILWNQRIKYNLKKIRGWFSRWLKY